MTHLDERLSIETPENVAFDYEVAGIGSRFLAALVDTLLILILQVVVNLALLLVVRIVAGDVSDLESGAVMWLLALFGLIAFAFFWGYYVFFEVLWNGQSPGKRWVGLRVIRTDGTPITLTESLIRNLVRLVDFMPAYYGIGVVTMFINSQSRRLGDLAAGTLVVRDRGPVTLESLASRQVMPTRGWRDAVVASRLDLPLERLTSQDIQMAEDFVQRRDQFSDPEGVARRVAEVLLKRMDVPAEQVTGISAQGFLLRVVHFSRAIANEPMSNER